MYDAWLTLRSRFQPGARNTTVSITARNIQLFNWDIAWFGILFGVTSNFLVIFVTRLNASPLLLSAVTSGPALVNILWQLSAARIVERSPDHQRLTLRTAVMMRLGFLGMAIVPLVLPRAWQAYGVVGLLLLQGIPTAVLAVAFSTMFAERVPRERMAAVVGTRNALLGLTSTLMASVCGLLLTVLPFPWNYQTILVIGFVASLGSTWAVSQLRSEPATPAPHSIEAPAIAPSGSVFRDRNFVRFVGGAGLLHLGMFMPAPLFPLYWVDTLHLSDGWISVFATTLSMMTIVGAIGLRAVAQRWRLTTLLGTSCVLFGAYPALTAMIEHPLWLAVAAGFAGIWGGAINVTLFNSLAEVSPPGQRPRYMGMFTWLMNIAIFAGPLLGAALANVGGVRLALLVAAGIRVLGGLLFLARPFTAWDRVPPPAALPSAASG